MKKKKNILTQPNEMQMYGPSNKNLDAAVKEVCAGNSLVREIVDDETMMKRHCIFGSVFDVVHEAEDEYTEGERSWKDSLTLLSEAISKLALAEKTLEDAYTKDHEPMEEEKEAELEPKEKKIVIPTKK
jgi:hypothetical protein